MNDLARRAFALVFAFLLVTSIPFAVVELGGPDVFPAQNASAGHGGTHIDDFEDGDLTIETSGWGGWNGDTGSLSVESSDPIVGSNSGNLTSDASLNTVRANADTPVSPTRVAFKLRISDKNGASGDRVDVRLENGSDNILRINFEDSSNTINARNGAGMTTVRSSWKPDTVYSIEIRDIDYANDQYDLHINGEEVAQNLGFATSVSELNEINVVSDTANAGTTRSVVFDSVELDGSAYTFEQFGGGLFEDFEDGDTTVESTGWSGWHGDNLDTTSDALYGDHSGKLTSNDEHADWFVTSETGSHTSSRIAVAVRLTGQSSGAGDDDLIIRVQDHSNTVAQFQFEDNTGSILVSATDTGKDWVVNQTYHIEFRNIDYSGNTYDVYLNGEELMTGVAFTSNEDGFDELEIESDTASNGGNRDVIIDNVEFGGEAFGRPDYDEGMTDDFEDDNLNVETAGWGSDWYGSSALETTGTQTLSGDFSANLTSTSSVESVEIVADAKITTVDTVTAEMRISDKNGASGDRVQMTVKDEDGDIIFRVYFEDSSNDIRATNGTGATTVVNGWSAGQTYEVKVTNMDFSTDTYDVHIDGQEVATGLSFGIDVDGYQRVGFLADTASGAATRNLTVDDVNAGVCVQNCDFSIATTGTKVSGTVVNQNGDPVSGATVQVWGVDYDQISASAGGTKKDQATDLIEDAKNKTPSEWTDQVEDDFRLTGSGGHFEQPDVVYAAVHSVDDWKVSPTTDQIRDNPTLDSPILSLDASRGETVTVAVSAWDGDKFVLRNAISPVRNDLHGEPIEASIVIETLVAPDDTLEKTQTTKTEINCNFIGCDWSSAFVEVQLTPGFYRVYVKGHAEDSYVIKVGDPVEIILEDLRKENGQVADQASDVTQNLDDGKFTKTTTTTSSDGSWSVSVGSNVKTVAIQAYKAPDVAENSSSLTYEDIISEYEDAYRDGEQINRLGSVYLPSEVRSVDPPQSGVTLTVQETTFPQLANRDDLEQWIRDLLEEMLNESLSDTTSAFQNRTEDVARSELESTYETLVDMYQNNAALRAIVDGLAEDSDRELVIRENLDEVTDSQMRDTVDLIYEGLSLLGDGAGGGSDIDEDIGNDTISQVWTLPGDIEDTSINLLIHWSNGTTDSLSTESEYLSLDKRTGLADQVVLDKYTIGDEDPSSLTFELLYVTDDGQAGRDRNTIRNPRFDGDIPSIDAIELTSLEPGPSEQVDIELHPRDAAKFGSIVSATVTGPGGADISTDVISSNGRVTGFKTSGSGVYHVALTFNNSDGDQFTETIRVFADDFNDDRPPSAQVRTGPTGRYLVVGDGLESGKIDVGDGGEVSVAAQIPQGGDVPGTIQLYLQDVGSGSRTEVTVSVVRGETESRVSQRVGVILHMRDISETAVLYREGDEPLPRNGSNAAGEVSSRSNGSTIQSFTEADGRLTILVENDPSFVERVLYRVRGVDLPIVSVSPAADLAELFAGPLELGSLLEGAIA